MTRAHAHGGGGDVQAGRSALDRGASSPRESAPIVHAAAIRAWGDEWVPIAWPHDGLQHDKDLISPGAQFETLIDGKPRSYRDRKAIAIEAIPQAQVSELRRRGEASAERAGDRGGVQARQWAADAAHHAPDRAQVYRRHDRQDYRCRETNRQKNLRTARARFSRGERKIPAWVSR